MTNKLTIAFTRREAELYRSHGLLEEAHHLYREALDKPTSLEPRLAAPLQEKIGQLEKEQTEVDIDIADVVSKRELDILRESWGDAHTPSDIGICASALCSIGLYEAAIEEYGKLVRMDQPQADYIDGLADCIVAVYALETIENAIESIVALYQPPEAHPTSLRIGLTEALARRVLDQPALPPFQSASAISPLPDKVEIIEKKVEIIEMAIPKRLGHGIDSIDSGLSKSVKEKGAARQLKSYFTNCLDRLQMMISSRFLRASCKWPPSAKSDLIQWFKATFIRNKPR
jgi:tetratricopeptide (TPR) repeat protein